MELLVTLSQALEQGKVKLVKELLPQALEAGINPQTILEEGLMAGMSRLGERFRLGEVFVPEVMLAARAMNAGAELLKPHLAEGGSKPLGRACLGTVKGDMHDIGKNLVRMMLEGKGIEVVDLGVDVSPETFVRTAAEQDCAIIACSALLTTTMPVMAQVVEAATAAGIRDRVKIMVGGAPVTEQFCRQIGADLYTDDAASAAIAAAALFS